SGRFYKQDITEPFELVDGHILIPDVPGLAAQPRRQRLAEATLETIRIAF
ncbi:MAG: o-succinylbenzoate synthase, partial [Demequinaceae bacterium]|nr:o-succinylbenzoate synthase [Demequinaceae bacterium]